MISDKVFNYHKAFMLETGLGFRGNISYGNYSGESYIDRLFSGMIINHSVFQSTDFTLSSFKDTIIENCDFSGSNFTKCDFSGCKFENCIFERCNFDSANLTNITLIGCTINRCNFDNTILQWASSNRSVQYI